MKALRALFLTAIIFCLAACGPIKTIPQTTYVLTSFKGVTTPMHVATRSRTSVLITNTIASAGYRSNQMLYMVSPYELKAYANNVWAAPPATFVTNIIQQSIIDQRYFSAVVVAPFSGTATYRVDTKLLKLQQEFLLPESHVRIQLSATLINNTTNRVIATHIFEVVVPSPGNNAYSGVIAANKGITEISNNLAHFTINHIHVMLHKH